MDQVVPRFAEPALLERIRLGEDEAFSEIFHIHVAAVRQLARGLAFDSAEAEDITAETFFRVLQTIRRGNGPRENVRAYLLTVARRVAWEWHGSRRDVPITDDELVTRAAVSSDSQNCSAEADLIIQAFSSLPERWRTVLWQTEVEGKQPAVVAHHFGLTANATAALARRARLGLRAAYLQAHLVVEHTSNGCRSVREKLGGYTAGSVGGAEIRKIEDHLDRCLSCRSIHQQLRKVCASLSVHAGAVMLLVPPAGLALASIPGAGVGTAGAVGTAASTGGGVGGVIGSGLSASAVAAGAPAKVALTLASTAAAGTLGIAAIPVVDHQHDAIDLPEEESVRLSIADSSPSTPPDESETQISVRTEHAESARRTEVPDPDSDPAEQQVTEFTLPTMSRAPSGVRLAPVVEPGTQLPPETTSRSDVSSTGPEQSPENPENDDGVGRNDPDSGEAENSPEPRTPPTTPSFSGDASAAPVVFAETTARLAE